MSTQYTTKYALIGLVISQEREQQGHDQKTFAKISGISQPTLSRIERGETVIDVEQLDKAAHALGLEVQELIDRANQFVEQMPEWGVEVVDRDTLKKNTGSSGGALLGAALAGFLIGMLLKK